VLYEMLTGRRLFDGETVSDTLAAVLRQEIPWPALPARTSARVHQLLHRCLERDPKQRLRDIGEVRIAINEELAHPEAEVIAGGAEARAAIEPSPTWRRALPWVLAALGLAFGARTVWTSLGLAGPARPLRLSVEPGADVSLNVTDEGPTAILSPDGSLLAFVARKNEDERPRLFLRRLDQLQAAPLLGTEGAHGPFFSPDGQWIAFFADGQLKRVAVSGGAAVVLANAPTDRGGTWSEDGTILFTPNFNPGVGLSRVSSSGGASEVLTSPDPAAGEVTHRWPQALAGGKAVLFTAHSTVGGYEDATIVVQSLPHGPKKVIVRGGYYGRYLPSGHVVYMHEGTLFAIPFDLAHLEATGAAVPVIEELVGFPFTAGAQFAFSNRGTLVYLPGRSAPMLSIQWLDRTGKLSPLGAVPGHYRNLRLSPDGTKVAMQLFDGKSSDVWVYDWGRDTWSKLTFEVTNGSFPVWAPDARRIAYTAMRGNQPGNIYWQRADGAGAAQLLTKSKNFQVATSWHPSGKYLAFQEWSPQTAYDVMILPIEGDDASGLKPGQPTPFLNSPFNEWEAAFSPDGQWLAYASNESGRLEVYVRPFPGPGGKWRISLEGGSYPTWSRNGRELFYESLDQRLMVASYAGQGGSFHAEKPWLWAGTRLPDLPGFQTLDLHPDGQRFVVLKQVGEQGEKRDKVVLFTNFFDELRRLAPTE
jgi:Tol biopolymer transport system component